MRLGSRLLLDGIGSRLLLDRSPTFTLGQAKEQRNQLLSDPQQNRAVANSGVPFPSPKTRKKPLDKEPCLKGGGPEGRISGGLGVGHRRVQQYPVKVIISSLSWAPGMGRGSLAGSMAIMGRSLAPLKPQFSYLKHGAVDGGPSIREPCCKGCPVMGEPVHMGHLSWFIYVCLSLFSAAITIPHTR